MSLSVEVTGMDGMRRFLEELPEEVMDAVFDEMLVSGKVIESGAKERARVNTGKFRASIHADGDRDELRVTVGTNDIRAAWFEFGTGVYGPRGAPIVIRPKNGKFLHWIDANGQHHFAREVVSKGLPAQPYLYPAFEAEKRPMLAAIEAAIAKALEGS
jgi:hypothetical protein